MRWSRHAGYGLSLGLIAASIACGDNASPTRSLLGDWELVSFTDHGVMGITTGTMTFNLDGTWEMIGTVTYPGEPIDSLRTGGTYIATTHTVALTSGADTYEAGTVASFAIAGASSVALAANRTAPQAAGAKITVTATNPQGVATTLTGYRCSAGAPDVATPATGRNDPLDPIGE